MDFSENEKASISTTEAELRILGIIDFGMAIQ